MRKIKKLLSIILPVSLVSSATSLIATSIMINKHKDFDNGYNGSTNKDPIIKQQQYFRFDQQNFTSKEEVINYALKKSKEKRYNYEVNTYSLDGKLFKSFAELETYINEKFSITRLETIHNPNNYLIKGNDELNSLVANKQNDKLVRVYEGKNRISYDNYEAALETYQNYEKVYDVEGIIKYNENDAIRAYEDILEEQLRENPKKKTVYEQGGILQTEQQIKDWLYDKQSVGFEYDGEIFSDFDPLKVKEILNKKEESFYKKHIKETLNPDLKTYWLTDQKVSKKGYYIGPKYIETTSKLEEANWNLINSYDPGYYFSFATVFGAIAFINNAAFEMQTIDVNGFDWRVQGEEDNVFVRFVEFLYKNKFINQALYNDIKNTFLEQIKEKQLENILKKSADRLELINLKDNPDFGNVQKMLVVFQRILASLKLSHWADEDLVKYTTDLFKDISISVLKTNNNVFNKTVDNFYKKIIKEFIQKQRNEEDQKLLDEGKEIPKRSEISNNFEDYMTFEDIYDLIMNPKNYLAKHNYLFEGTLKGLEVLEGVLDDIMEVVGAVGSIAGGISDLQEASITGKKKSLFNLLEENDESTDVDFDDNDLVDKLIDIENEVNQEISNKGISEDDAFKAWGIIDRKKQSFQVPIIGPQFVVVAAVLSIVAAAWTIQKLLSFISWKTFEFKIDENQSGYYMLPVFKIPLFGIEVTANKPKVMLTQLSESLVDSLPIVDGIKVNKLYELEDKYYSSYEVAKDVLVKKILADPTKYLIARKILSSIMEKDQGYYLPKEILENISKTEYDAIIKKSRLNYADLLFKLYIKNNKGKDLYLDGFGNGFDTPIAALASMKEKLIKPENFITKYEYRTQNNTPMYFESVDEVRDYIRKHQIINSKLVLKSDLLKSSTYSHLKEQDGHTYQVYELNFYGTKKYFTTLTGAKNYLMKNLEYSEVRKDQVLNIYYWEEQTFYGQNKFQEWIDEHTKIVIVEEVVDQNNKNKGGK